MATKIGEFREMLIECIEAVRQRRIDADEGASIAKLAAQVNASLQAEITSRRITMDRNGTLVPLGDLSLGQDVQIPPSEPKQIEEKK